jgi:beta-mannosidase
VAGRSVSDTADTTFGIHSISYFLPGQKMMTISINGVPIMCKGGNWGIDEAMKRIPMKRLDAQMRLHHDANCTMVRNWIGMSTEEDFYKVCDKYGILIWDDFWLANPADGPIPIHPDWFLQNAREKIVRFRNHPSIGVWCGRNEGNPPKVIDDGLAVLIHNLDPVRFYQKHSAATNGVGGGGPYSLRPDATYFGPFRDSLHTEIGAPSIPTLEAVHHMMPEKDWWPLNDDWAEHDLCRGAQRGDQYPQQVSDRLGQVMGLPDFVRKSQLVNYECYRAIFEGRNSKLFSPASGVLLWMSNPAQPSFVWQLYSYDLEPNGA